MNYINTVDMGSSNYQYECQVNHKYYLTQVGDRSKWYYYDMYTGQFGRCTFNNFADMDDLFEVE